MGLTCKMWFYNIKGQSQKIKCPYIGSKLHSHIHNNYNSPIFVNKFKQIDTLETFPVMWNRSFSSNIPSNGNYKA